MNSPREPQNGSPSHTCPGCGAVLQTSDPVAAGYVPPTVLLKAGPETICRRCYRIRHYGEALPAHLSTQTLLGAASRGVSSSDASLYLVDPFDFEGTWRPDWLPLFEKRPYYLVLNKIDLLPAMSKPDEIIAWARTRAAGVKPAPAGIIAVGTRNAADLKPLRELIETSHWRSLALVGATNVGKSSLLRALAGPREGLPTTSHFPGTTQNVVTVDTGEGLKLVDTPGLAPGDRLSDVLCPQCGALLTPSRQLEAMLYHVEPGQAVLFSGLAMFALRTESTRTFLCYAGSGVHFNRTSAEKGETMLGQSISWLGPPCSDCSAAIAEWERHEVRLKDGHDLVVAGLGWISLRGGDAEVTVWAPAGMLVTERPGMFGLRKRPVARRASGTRTAAKRKNFGARPWAKKK